MKLQSLFFIVSAGYFYIAYLEKSAALMGVFVVIFMAIETSRRSNNHRLKKILDEVLDELDSVNNNKN